MGRWLDYENPIFSFLSRLVDLMLLNLLTVICCIPIITIGASITAAHYTALKLHRGEGYVWKNFRESFKENFKQSTVIWLIFAVYFVLEYLAYITLSTGGMEMAQAMQGWVLATAVLGLCVMLWTFPLQSKFVNKITKTVFNAFIMVFKHIFRTILILVVTAVPFLLNFNGIPLLLTLGISGPIYLSAIIYNKPFKKMEKIVLGSLAQEQ